MKAFDPVPLRQTQPFKHNKKHSAELGWCSCCGNIFVVPAWKGPLLPLVAPLCTAGILTQGGQAYGPDELKSWWQKNWPRIYPAGTEAGVGRFGRSCIRARLELVSGMDLVAAPP